MTCHPIVHVFPGQGDFSVTPLVKSLREPVVRRNFAHVSTQVERIAAEYGIHSLVPAILSEDPPGDRKIADLAPGAQQLATYITPVRYLLPGA
ncbi:hypothetical protein [Streptomyces sp. NPDC002403]